MNEIVNAIPFGSDNALSSREIWKRVDAFSPDVVANRLAQLADLKAIKSRKEPASSQQGFKWIYWREAAV
ncbi:hypothetical protein SAMN05444159_1303 [Bradyrhizobium lablabi]|uniref:Uncharacterized protein n=1 Tax=Bradyrhizobium lablabi TaxID=722472 RepID=A0A1M6LKH6_9BRAD|nr:hypothetical protein [Bradyrhizobium lablabi]SHJ71689.1 hypothetical protein SAMN05444159_1303 [Bradyrhizobium lablabi]